MLIEILDELVECNKIYDNFLFINSFLYDVFMSVLSLNLFFIRIFEMVVFYCCDKMNSRYWDFVLCSLVGWF